MYRIKLSIYNISSIDIYTDSEKFKDIFLSEVYKIQKTIPITAMECMPYDTIPEKNALVIFNGKNKNMRYYPELNTAYVETNSIRVLDFIYIMLSMFAYDLSKDSKYLIHSSALKYDDDKSIVLVGDANAGKSSLAYNLIENYGMTLISNDHTVVGVHGDELYTEAGTKPLELRLGVVKQHFPRLDMQLGDLEYDDVWSKKVIVNDHIKDGLIADSDYGHVTDIFQINLSQDGSSFIKEKDPIDQRLYLYEQIAKEIKGTYNLITGFNYPMPSVETPEMLQALDGNVMKVLKSTKVHMAKGNIKDLSESMVKVLEKRK